MFKIQNTGNKKFVKDAITRAVRIYETAEQAQRYADALHRDSVLHPRAFQLSARNYQVVVA